MLHNLSWKKASPLEVNKNYQKAAAVMAWPGETWQQQNPELLAEDSTRVYLDIKYFQCKVKKTISEARWIQAKKHQRAWEPWDASFYRSDVLIESLVRKESFRSVSGAPRSCLLSSSVHPYHSGRLFRRKTCKTSLFNSALCSQLWFLRGVWEVGQQRALLTLGVHCYHPFDLQALTGDGKGRERAKRGLRKRESKLSQ